MEGLYEITYGGQTAGTAKVSAEGLYYRFDCQCRLDRKALVKICVACGEAAVILGTPVPEGHTFRLLKRLPIKRFSGETMRFYIEGNAAEKSGIFVTVSENEPFAHLKDLKNAVFSIRDGVSGIVINKQ
ncbi:MAG: hypothetical protein IJO72_04990 [Oscillospiraceae bacterium]|nr:hypothetical protein [Oscillospiraceae bacterium]